MKQLSYVLSKMRSCGLRGAHLHCLLPGSYLNSLQGPISSLTIEEITMIQGQANLRHAALTPWKPDVREGFDLF